MKCTIAYREQAAIPRSAIFLHTYLRWPATVASQFSNCERPSSPSSRSNIWIELVYWEVRERLSNGGLHGRHFYCQQMGNRTWAFDWPIYIWPWIILKVRVKVVYIFRLSISRDRWQNQEVVFIVMVDSLIFPCLLLIHKIAFVLTILFLRQKRQGRDAVASFWLRHDERMTRKRVQLVKDNRRRHAMLRRFD